MKKIYLIIVLVSCGPATFAQTLFTCGSVAVDKSEFLRAYNKNKNPVTDKEKALREYLGLYINFKLKVKAARDMKLDTLSQLIGELSNFRAQVEESYMTNEPALNSLIDEAFARSQKDKHIIHFFTPLDDKATPADTLKAYQAMNEIQAQLKKDNNDFEKTAKTVSEKIFPVRSSDLGFLTVFSLPYDYENIIYSLKPGETGKPYRTAKGLHVFKLARERNSVGKWKIAQILFSIPPENDPTAIAFLKKKADSVYNLLVNGADFAKMANTYSDDKMTYMTGGEIPEFGTGKFEAAFEAEVFKLKKDGEICRPFLSPFGYHIIKKIKQIPTPSDKNAEYVLSEIKQKVIKDNRVNIAKDVFFKDVMKQVILKKNTAVKETDILRFADTVAANLQAAVSKKIPIYDMVIFTVGKKNIKGVKWLEYFQNIKSTNELYLGESNASLYERFISTTVFDHYKANLEEYNIDFKYQMDEFRDGNVLFEIMDRNVWNAAALDSTGLLNHYKANKTKYRWGASANIIIFNCSSKAVADETIAELKAGKDWRKIVAEKNTSIQADSGRYEMSQIPLNDSIAAKEGLISEPVTNTFDPSVSFFRFIKIYDADQQRSFEEARGMVINDYQVVLEERWLNVLKKKYPVKVNEAVFESLLKD